MLEMQRKSESHAHTRMSYGRSTLPVSVSYPLLTSIRLLRNTTNTVTWLD